MKIHAGLWRCFDNRSRQRNVTAPFYSISPYRCEKIQLPDELLADTQTDATELRLLTATAEAVTIGCGKVRATKG